MTNTEELRRAAKAARDNASQKKEAARAESKRKIAALKNPPQKFVSMPDQTGDAELDSEADLDAVQAGFRARASADAGRKLAATDSEYWFAVCFQTREQKEAFLAAMKLMEHGDKYLDGQVLAQRLGVELPPADVPYNTGGKCDKAWAEFL